MASHLEAFPDSNIHGRFTLGGSTSPRRLREVRAARKTLLHRTKNGIYDPLTFYHILDAVMELKPDQLFRTVDLVDYLRATRQQLVWDSVTVGRVLNDIAESLQEANATSPIRVTRRWNGMHYFTREEPENRVALANLLEDLFVLCEAEIAQELTGQFPKRTETPMLHCPSVTVGNQ